MENERITHRISPIQRSPERPGDNAHGPGPAILSAMPDVARSAWVSMGADPKALRDGQSGCHNARRVPRLTGAYFDRTRNMQLVLLARRDSASDRDLRCLLCWLVLALSLSAALTRSVCSPPPFTYPCKSASGRNLERKNNRYVPHHFARVSAARSCRCRVSGARASVPAQRPHSRGRSARRDRACLSTTSPRVCERSKRSNGRTFSCPVCQGSSDAIVLQVS